MAVIFLRVFCSNAIVCPSIPHPISAILEFSVRLSLKLNARRVTRGLPEPCLSALE